MTEKIYLDYTRDELDAQYTNVKNDADAATQKRLQSHSADVAERLATSRDLSYGDHPSNRFDLYRAEGPPGPVIVFTHGGQWQRGSTTASCGWAEAALSHGDILRRRHLPDDPGGSSARDGRSRNGAGARCARAGR